MLFIFIQHQMKELLEQLEYFKKEGQAKDLEIAFLENKLKEANEEEKVNCTFPFSIYNNYFPATIFFKV